jgi:hypothetical protein
VSIPDAVKVGPFRYAIVADRHTLHSIDVEANGTTAVDLLRIHLDPDRPHDAVAVTLLHELLHAIWYAAGRRGEKLAEEEAIRTLSPLLLDVLKANPDVLAFLVGDGDAA